MTDDQTPPTQFPSYPPPNPSGVPLLSHLKQQAPLNKMINRLLKPKIHSKTPKVRKWKKKNVFY